MPLYEYQCQECGLRFERRQSFSEEPVRICPECTGSVIRLIQPAGIIFKGSGFYVTDSRSKSPTALPGNRKDGNGSSADTPATEKSGEAKKPKTTETAKSESSKAKVDK